MRLLPTGARDRIPLLCLLATASLAVAACPQAKDTEAAAPAAPVTSPAAPAAAPADTHPGVELVLVPGKSLGPISLDMEEKDLRALGLEVRSPAEGFLDVGPYRVVLKAGRVDSASVDFLKVAKAVAIGDRRIDRAMTLEAAAAAIGECGAPTHNIGASIVECRGGTVSVIRGGSSGTITSVGIAKGK